MKYLDRTTLNAVALAALVSICIRLLAGDGLFAFITGSLLVAAAALIVFAGNAAQKRLSHSDSDFYTQVAASKRLYKKGDKEAALLVLRDLLHAQDGGDINEQ